MMMQLNPKHLKNMTIRSRRCPWSRS